MIQEGMVSKSWVAVDPQICCVCLCLALHESLSAHVLGAKESQSSTQNSAGNLGVHSNTLNAHRSQALASEGRGQTITDALTGKHGIP